KAAIPDIEKANRAANYLAVAMIYLKDNVLGYDGELKKEHVKERLLGHWGTCPAITLVYTHVNHLLKTQLESDPSLNMFYVVGPGHGAPAVLANLYLEDSIGHFDKKYEWSKEGIRQLIRGFSWPKGFPSHVNAETPGAIHEGGELGYALSVSFGAVMDNPDLIVTCIVGDGEAETGPTATAWHSYKYIDPKESGAVLPILNCNGYKISESTIFGNMSDDELVSLFSGYGYQVRIVQTMPHLHGDMIVSLRWAYTEIRRIQHAARSGNPLHKPRWPMIVLRTPKGMTAPEKMHGKQIVGTWRAHQVPLKNVVKDEEEWEAFKGWLESYKVKELISEDGRPCEEILRTLPREDRLMGRHPSTYKGRLHDLDRPAITDFGVEKAGEWKSCMQELGNYLAEVIKRNQHTFRIFSPDEMESNKLDKVFSVTRRNFQWDPFSVTDGRVIEVLSEHQCQGWMQGYTLTGRTALFPSYESFIGIVSEYPTSQSSKPKVV
ncbi:hypothetical protein HK104_006494, partial [Borealophlyctis nickersoniae]